MANVNVTIRMDEEIREQADALFEEMGMTLSTAINVFVRQCLRERAIPFQVGMGSGIEYQTVPFGEHGADARASQ